MGNLVRVAVAVHHPDHGNAELLGLGHGNRFLVRVDHHQHVRAPAHFLDPAQGPLQLVALARQIEDFLLGQPGRVVAQLLIEVLQCLDGARDGLPIGEHAAQPTVVDVVLTAALGRVRNDIAGRTLGSDEQHAAAAADDVAHNVQRRVQHGHGLLQIDDVDFVAYAKDVRRHLWVPAPCMVTEMHASFQELAHGERRHRHRALLFRFRLRGASPGPGATAPGPMAEPNTGSTAQDVSLAAVRPRVDLRRR